jgi:REP element-mobilizing transposase RayT
MAFPQKDATQPPDIGDRQAMMPQDLRDSPPSLPSRKHPHRLDPAMYRLVDWPVFVTFRAKWRASLCKGAVPCQLVDVLGRIGHRRCVRVHAYCLMPDHLHVVVSVKQADGDVAKWIWYVKRETSKMLGAAGMWQRSYWDTHAREDEDLEAAVEYLLANPVRKKLCDSWHEWPHSWSEWHPPTKGRDPNMA